MGDVSFFLEKKMMEDVGTGRIYRLPEKPAGGRLV